MPGVAARTSSQAVRLGRRMEVIMRIRRTILAPPFSRFGTVGRAVAGPVLALTTAAAPLARRGRCGSVSPDLTIYHG